MSDEKDVDVLEVIRTRNARIGRGTPEDPFRRLTQYWSKDGELLFEDDPGETCASAGHIFRPGGNACLRCTISIGELARRTYGTTCTAVGHAVMPGSDCCTRCEAKTARMPG